MATNFVADKEWRQDEIVDDDELNWQGREANLKASAY
jgi:hypothetical protein